MKHKTLGFSKFMLELSVSLEHVNLKILHSCLPQEHRAEKWVQVFSAVNEYHVSVDGPIGGYLNIHI